MSQPIPEMPPELEGLDDFAGRPSTEIPNEKYVFRDVIPKLGPSIKGEKVPALLKGGGITGVIYAQIPLVHMKLYESYGWGQVIGSDGSPLPVYAIEGPEGRVDCVLLCKGRAIPGVSPNSNKRLCRIHKEIRRITGLGGDPDAEAKPAKSGAKKKG